MADDGFTRDPEAIAAQLRMAHTRRAKAIADLDRCELNIGIAKHNARIARQNLAAENHCIDSLLDALMQAQDAARLEEMVQG